MTSLYLDNCRGFSETLLPLADVNFLVGENSTGKTSILRLLHVFSSPDFWVNRSLETQHVRLGHFKDLVSVHAKDQRYFRIGVYCETTKGDRALQTGFMATFREENGLPTLAHLTLIRHTKEIHIRITTKRLYYKVRDVEPTTTQNLSVLCSQWSREHLSRTQGYQLLRLPDGLGNAQDVPLIIPLAMLGAIEAGKPPVEGLDAPVDLPLFGPNMIWLAPIRTKPRRTYDDVRLQYSPEGSHTPYLIRKLFQSHQDAQKFKTMIEEVGENSSLYESIAIKPFGRGETAPFELDIVLDGKRLNLNNVGYGVSQSLPVIVEILARAQGQSFAIQQPEVHLHPKTQAALGDLLYTLAVTDKKQFLVETHSDYLIDRFRLNYRRHKRKTKVNAQVVFFERRNKRNHITVLPIDEKGGLPASQPKSYREFFVREEMRILGL